MADAIDTSIYMLPKSSGFGQPIKIKDVGRLFVQLNGFFSDLASNLEVGTVSLNLYGSERFGSLDYAETMHVTIGKEFGPPGKIFKPRPNPTGKNNVTYEWNLDSSLSEKAISFMVQCRPLPKTAIPPLRLVIWYHFDWKIGFVPDSPLSKERKQRLGIHITNKFFIQPALAFPFDSRDPRLETCAKRIDDYGIFSIKREYLKPSRS